jgi:hypothetical protein
MRIDKSGIPADKLNDPRLPAIEAGLRRAVEDSPTRLYACLHEAGHAIFMERAGVAFTFRGPAIWYDIRHDILTPAIAGVSPGVPGENWTANSLQIARWSCAGFIVAETLMPHPRNAYSKEDTSDFDSFADDMRQSGATEESIQSHWEAAKLDVAKDLESAGFKRRIWAQARIFKQQLETDFAAADAVTDAASMQRVDERIQQRRNAAARGEAA